MNKKEATQVLAILIAAYPNHYKNASQADAQGVITLWSTQLADLPAEIVFMALNKHISTNKFPPTIAEIKEKISGLHWEAYEKVYQNFAAELMSEEERSLYERIYRATEGYKYDSRIEPTISQLIGGGNNRLLSEGEEK